MPLSVEYSVEDDDIICEGGQGSVRALNMLLKVGYQVNFDICNVNLQEVK